MTPAEIQLIVSGGAVGVLIVGMLLILRGDLVTKGTLKAATQFATDLLVEVKASHAREIGELVRDRDDWKAIAKEAVHEAGELGEALTVRNRIDEDLLRRVGVTVRLEP